MKAKAEYQNALRRVLKKGDNGKPGERLEILRLFIESTDFGKLRSEYEKHLVEGKRVKFRLYLANGKPSYEMQIF